MNSLKELQIKRDLEPIVSAYKRGYTAAATKRFNKLIAEQDLKYWEVVVLKGIAAYMIKED